MVAGGSRVGGIHGGQNPALGRRGLTAAWPLATGLLEGSRPSPGLPAASTASGLSPPLLTAPGPALSSPSAPDTCRPATGFHRRAGLHVTSKHLPVLDRPGVPDGEMSRAAPQPAIPGGPRPLLQVWWGVGSRNLNGEANVLHSRWL